MTPDQTPEQTPDRPGRARGVSRRSVLAGALATAAVVPLAACAGGGPAGGGGERLRVAFAAGGTWENLDPHVLPQFVDQARARACFDTLVGFSQEMTAVPRLAQSWESDPTGTRWRIRLRPARFHDGRPVTAGDVLYSYRRIADPATTGSAAAAFATVDFAASRAVSDTELELVLGAPNFLFPLSWGATGTEIVPQGATDFTNPVGSGPFRYVSFTPGGPAVYRAYEGYWDGPPPSRELEFVPINEESARVGALLSGQVAYAYDLRATSARQLEGDGRVRVLSAPASTQQFVNLRIDRPPFVDPRLRDAVKYGIDREALVRVVLLGRGQVANDLFGQGLQYYADGIPQVTRDVARASALVAEAGARGTTVELQTSGLDPVFQPAAQLISQQLGEIGLQVTPRVLPSANYVSEVRRSGVASHTRSGTLPIPDYVGRRMLTGSAQNFTGYRNPGIDRLYAQAISTPDEGARAQAFTQIQQLLHSESGYLLWANGDLNNGIAAGLQGVENARPSSSTWGRFDKAVVT